MIADYTIILRDNTGTQFRKDITGIVKSVDCVRAVNAVGTCTVTIPPALMDSQIQVDGRIYVYQTVPGRTMELVGETWYFIRDIDLDWSEAGEILYTIRCVDLNDLLDRRIVAYAAGEPESDKTDQADDMIKAVVRENLGTLAPVGRALDSTVFSVQPDDSAVDVIVKTFPWRQLLMVAQEIADEVTQQSAQHLYFDIVATGEATCEFRTYPDQRGRDRRSSQGAIGGITFSPERGNLINPRYTRQRSQECTFSYAGGQGEGVFRDIQTASEPLRIQASPFNRRERFVDARQTDDSTAVQAEALSRVYEGRPQMTISGEIRETDAGIFQVHFGFGDFVTIEMAGILADCRINAYQLVISRALTGQSFTRTLKILAIQDQPITPVQEEE